MNKFIVCTSINNPTKAIRAYDSMEDWKLVVVGDKKTPPDYHLERGVYLSPTNQEDISKELSNLIGWNCIQRRNFGLLYAFNLGADVVCTVDDDNIPLSNWGKELFVNRSVTSKEFLTDADVFDPIGATSYKHLWHRGFPLELIPARNYERFESKEIIADVQADFWNGDPDIDAFCRLEHKPNCNFKDKDFPFTSNKISPFNSQNTFLSKRIAKDYFLFPHIGRMDDIWAAYYVLSKGYKVVYNKATVIQERNEHNLINDLKNEYIGYENNLELIQSLIKDPEEIRKFLPEKTKKAWDVYRSLLS
jgi:hypothetical protein